MTLTIGRCTLLGDPYDMVMSGDDLSFTADAESTTLAQYQAVCQQMRGMIANRDENAFPIVWSEDPALDGFYTDFAVEIEPSTMALVNGFGRVRVRCRRVGASATPRIEVVGQSFVRTNSHALTPTSAVLNCIPTGISGVTVESDIGAVFAATAAATSSASETGVMTMFTANAQATVKSGRYSLNTTPADRYDGSAVIELSFDNGSTHVRLVGTQLAPQLLGNTYYRWRVGNGFFRIGPNVSGSSGFRMSTYNGGSWEDTDIVIIDGIAGDLAMQDGVPSIVINSPNKCVLSVSYGEITMMVTVVRGLRLAFVSFASAGTTYKWGARSSAAEAGTAITGGLRRTSNDANGNRWVFCVPVAATSDTVNGLHYQTTATTSGVIGVGVEHNGSAATGTDTATVLRDSFYLPALMDERVVIR
jgi:hypothetical protein